MRCDGVWWVAHDLAVSDICHSPKNIASCRASPKPDKKHCELGLTGAAAAAAAEAVAPETRRQIKWQADWLLTGQTPRMGMGMAMGIGFGFRVANAALRIDV